MGRPRAADDFASIRARIEELRRERACAPAEPEARPSPLPDRGAATPNKAPQHRLPLAIRQKFLHRASAGSR
jgi:hypothetical protein